jgi:hypothetical protein
MRERQQLREGINVAIVPSVVVHSQFHHHRHQNDEDLEQALENCARLCLYSQDPVVVKQYKNRDRLDRKQIGLT